MQQQYVKRRHSHQPVGKPTGHPVRNGHGGNGVNDEKREGHLVFAAGEQRVEGNDGGKDQDAGVICTRVGGQLKHQRRQGRPAQRLGMRNIIVVD